MLASASQRDLAVHDVRVKIRVRVKGKVAD